MMKGRFGETLRAIAVAACVAGLGVAAVGAQQPAAPDNSKVNTRDRAKGATTADQQSNAKSDVEITKEIRQAIVADKELSTYAHNVKIVTRRGKVTLKGPVTTVEEKSTVEAKAAEVAGAANVTNQISIAPKSGAKSTSKKAGT
jgi:hyperosmotically inducible periplasmic protein